MWTENSVEIIRLSVAILIIYLGREIKRFFPSVMFVFGLHNIKKIMGTLMERNENHWLVLTQYSEQPRKVTFIYPHHLDKDF